jgi:hypothetical protein
VGSEVVNVCCISHGSLRPAASSHFLGIPAGAHVWLVGVEEHQRCWLRAAGRALALGESRRTRPSPHLHLHSALHHATQVWLGPGA